MAIPDFQTLMLPFLKAVEDGKEHPFKDVVEKLSIEFQLTQDELAEMLPSRRAPTFYNRVAWAKFYLKKAGLIAQIKRSYLSLTELGKKALNSNPAQINIKYLEQFPEYLSFKENVSTDSQAEIKSVEVESTSTPEEILENAYSKLNASLVVEILENIMQCSPAFFDFISA